MNKLNAVMATRILKIKNTKKKVIVKIGKPHQTGDGPIYHCFYQILGIGNNKVRQSFGGLNSIHAIQLVLEKIGMDLYVANQSCNGNLSWDGSEDEDIGFPLPDNILTILKDE